MEIGNVCRNIKCESFLDTETKRIRVRPLINRVVSPEMVIECSRGIRENYPIGTKFYCEEVKVCKKPQGRLYLRAKDQMIYLIE